MTDVQEQRDNSPNIQIVQLLLKRGADVNAQNNNYSTPLHLATSSEIARLLLQYGADIDARDQNHRTPLHLIALRSCVSEKLCDS